MGEGSPLGALLDQETLRKLSYITKRPDIRTESLKKDRTPRKDKLYVQALEESPKLGEQIRQALRRLAEKGIPMPIVHVTSRAVHHVDGTEISTGYIENIQKNGFRPRDTNVAAFTERGNSVRIGSPDYFLSNPHKLLRDMAEIISHYQYHGIRTNKTSLGKIKDQGVGIPTMLVIDTRGVQLLKGTDYDDHFRLYNQVPASNIMGAIDLDGKNSSDISDIKTVTREFVDRIDSFLHQEVPEGSNS